MAPLLLPPSLTGADTAAPSPELPDAGLEALIKEARRRARRRRLAIAAAVVVLAGLGTALALVLSDSLSSRNSDHGQNAVVATQTLKLDLAGFGTPLLTQLDRGPCPNGRTRIAISVEGVRAGSLTECVLTIQKWDVPNWGVKKIATTTRDTYALRDGTIVTREHHVFHFARDQVHSNASFQGEIVGGSGRYARAHGSVSGGGVGINGHADWKLTLQLRR